MAKVPREEANLDEKTGVTPYYSTIMPLSSNLVIPCYSSNIPTAYASAGYNQHDKPPIQKSTSDNSLHFYEKIENQSNRLSNEYAR